MSELLEQAKKAKIVSRFMMCAKTDEKNKALNLIADYLVARSDEWLRANDEDMKAASDNNVPKVMLDRLKLTKERIEGIAEGVRKVTELPDPVGISYEENVLPNGMKISKRSVPLGVIAIIYEARPNVTVDAAALCLKSGNVCILRGGKEAINSNLAAEKIMRDALKDAGFPEDAISLVHDTSRESANELMHMNEYVDVLIPRGGAGLIRNVTNNSSVPVIRTGEGVCHVYVDESADISMAATILENAKCQRPSVCNAAECVVIHEKVLKQFLDKAVPLLEKFNVELRADERALGILKDKAVKATDEDWDSEYNDYILAVKTVDSFEEACEFIMDHTTGHSECIVTENAENAEEFLNRIDAAAVYVNASTRFTDGGEFGMGAEIGISTQKLHARGPMGLKEMTSYKYTVTGNGQIRKY